MKHLKLWEEYTDFQEDVIGSSVEDVEPGYCTCEEPDYQGRYRDTCKKCKKPRKRNQQTGIPLDFDEKKGDKWYHHG